MIRVLYFARLAEELDCREEVINEQFLSINELLEHLKERGEPWDSTLSNGNIMIALNQTMTQQQSRLSDGDEVAFFPPVTGG